MVKEDPWQGGKIGETRAMRWWRCLIRGENFLMTDTQAGRIEKVGFYATRCVEAASPEEAEMQALAMIRAEIAFAPPRGQARPKDARVYFEEIVEVAAPQEQGGATWFRIEEDGGG